MTWGSNDVGRFSELQSSGIFGKKKGEWPGDSSGQQRPEEAAGGGVPREKRVSTRKNRKGEFSVADS